MIIWLNGTFGAGKTSTADRLASLVPGSRVTDPEQVGYLLTACLPDQPVHDFQDWAAWRTLVPATLIEITRLTGQHLIAPQTVMKREYLDEIFDRLRAEQLTVFHVVLDAADAVLRSRIEGSDEAREWRLEHLDEYQAARDWMVEAADLVVDTAASTPPQIARRIVAALPPMQSVPGAVSGRPATGKASQRKASTDKASTDKAGAEVISPAAAGKTPESASRR